MPRLSDEAQESISSLLVFVRPPSAPLIILCPWRVSVIARAVPRHIRAFRFLQFRTGREGKGHYSQSKAKRAKTMCSCSTKRVEFPFLEHIHPSSSPSSSPRHSLVTLSSLSINWPRSRWTLTFFCFFPLAVVWGRTSFSYQILRCSPVSTPPSQLSIFSFLLFPSNHPRLSPTIPTIHHPFTPHPLPLPFLNKPAPVLFTHHGRNQRWRSTPKSWSSWEQYSDATTPSTGARPRPRQWHRASSPPQRQTISSSATSGASAVTATPARPAYCTEPCS